MGTIFRHKGVANGVTFNDDSVRPDGAIKWGIDVLDGWKRTAPVKGIFTPVESADGEIAADFFPTQGRQLAIGGFVLAKTAAQAEDLEDYIIGEAFPVNTDIQLTRYEPVPKYVVGRVVDDIIVDYVEPWSFRWAVAFRCPNPFKYALTSIPQDAGVAGLSSGGVSFPVVFPLVFTITDEGSTNQVLAFNDGTAPSAPIVTIKGPLPSGWRLENETTGEYLLYDVDLGAADELVIDFYNETALLNGFPVTVTVSGDFWRVEKGANTIKLYGTYHADAMFTVDVRSAWR